MLTVLQIGMVMAKWLGECVALAAAFSLFASGGCKTSKTSGEGPGEVQAAATEPASTPPESINTREITVELVPTKEESELYREGGPAINLETPEVGRLRGADEVVVPASKLRIILDYPLTNPSSLIVIPAADDKGFTRKQLVVMISEKYHAVYDEEERTATIKTTPREKRKGLINRNRTNGIHGIWGHDLGDLVLHTIVVKKAADGTTELALGIDS